MTQTSVREFSKLPEVLLTRHEEGSFVTQGSVLEVEGKCFIVALWRNKSAPQDIPWRVPSEGYLRMLKDKEPYKLLMSQPELAGKELVVPDEDTLIDLLGAYN